MAYSVNEQRVNLAVGSPTKVLTPAVIVLIILVVLQWATGFLSGQLRLDPQLVARGQVWRLLTYPFVNSGCQLISVCLVMLFLGSAVEREWGAKSLLMLLMAVTLVCGLIWTGVGLILATTNRISPVGSGGSVWNYALFAMLGILHWNRRFLLLFWPMLAQHIAWLMIGIGIVISLRNPLGFIWVSGALMAWLYTKLVWRSRGFGWGKSARTSHPDAVSRFKDLGS